MVPTRRKTLATAVTALFCLATVFLATVGMVNGQTRGAGSPTASPQPQANNAAMTNDDPGAALRIAITFDDLPAHGPLPPGETRLEVASKIIAALHNAHVPPIYGFVN